MKNLDFDTFDLWPACVACALQTLSQVLACGAKFARRAGASVELDDVASGIEEALEADRLACLALSEGETGKLIPAALSAYRMAEEVVNRLDELRPLASVKASADFDLLRSLASAVQKALASLAGIELSDA